MSTIVINAVSAKSGGSATYIYNLLESLARFRPQMQFLVWLPPGADLANGTGNVCLKYTDVGRASLLRRFIWDQFTLRRILKTERASLLLSTADFGMLFPPCPQILMVRNGLFFSDYYNFQVLPQKPWRFRLQFRLRRRLIAWSVHFSDLVVTSTAAFLADVRRWIAIPDKKSALNPFGVPLQRFAAPAAEEKNGARSFRFLYVSEYSDYKNLTALLLATKLLCERGHSDFVVYSTADPLQYPHEIYKSREQDLELLADPAVAACVRLGAVAYAEIVSLYQGSDVFIFPSLVESFGHPLVEAMASGLPVVASDTPLHREVCGEAALYFDQLDVGDLAGKMSLLWTDPELRAELGRIGRERALRHFDWDEHVRRQLHWMQLLVANR